MTGALIRLNSSAMVIPSMSAGVFPNSAAYFSLIKTMRPSPFTTSFSL
jgi:hypothetical protein